MTKNEIIAKAEQVATKLNTMIEVRDYTEYGDWTSISFMTDKFGGTYVHINLNNETLRMINWFGRPEQTEVDPDFLEELVRVELAKALKERDLDAIYDQVNAEYN